MSESDFRIHQENADNEEPSKSHVRSVINGVDNRCMLHCPYTIGSFIRGPSRNTGLRGEHACLQAFRTACQQRNLIHGPAPHDYDASLAQIIKKARFAIQFTRSNTDPTLWIYLIAADGGHFYEAARGWGSSPESRYKVRFGSIPVAAMKFLCPHQDGGECSAFLFAKEKDGLGSV